MTNPIRIHPPFTLPPISIPVANADGNITDPWYQFLIGLFTRSGGTDGGSTQEAMDLANEALSDAQSAASLAATASNTANAALTQANAVAATAQTAQQTAAFANGTSTVLNATTLKIASNLADLSSNNAARANLGLETVPAVFHFPGLATGTAFCPIFKGCSTPTNLAQTLTRSGTVPTGDVSMTLSVIRGATVSTIGTIVLVNHSQFTVLPIIPAFRLFPSDILQLQATAADATLRDLMIGIPLTLV